MFKAAVMSDSDTEDPVDPQVLELHQKLTMVEEQLEVIKNETDEKLRRATQAAKQALKEAEEARQKAETSAARVTELEQELTQQTEQAAELEKEREQIRLKTELDRLRQLEEVRQQFDKERKRYRWERERDLSTIAELERQLEEERMRGQVAGVIGGRGRASGAEPTSVPETTERQSSESLGESE